MRIATYLTALALSAMLMLGLVGCSRGGEEDNGGTKTTTSTTTTTAKTTATTAAPTTTGSDLMGDMGITTNITNSTTAG